ncbi:uracil-DNA glycosylase [Thelephora ganbajun]|uniref:Uracil-DNA glycosylase n=1 Tax=Thelephora ganbajun TaxID=370292 RepID=A0ACB6ZGV3_THEGA|nr:uracil-DNA glycosylase [Thelephora ganbajun]
MLGGSSAKKTKVDGPSAAVVSKIQTLNSIPFNLNGFINSLTEEQRDLLGLEIETMGKSWLVLKLLHDEIKQPYFIALKKFLREEGVRGTNDTLRSCKVYPPPKDIYSWSNYTPLGRVKVVIVGQDPYFGPKQAHGLCFSVPQGVPVPPSLVNIYTEIKSEYPEFVIPKHGNLIGWARNGVLMLNTCLTVKAGSPGSHSNRGWEKFTDKVIAAVDKWGGANLPTADANSTTKVGVGRGIVFMAWGSWAQKRVSGLNRRKHLVLTSAHPSPRVTKGFLGNGHFKSANDWLEEKYGSDGKVDWCKLNADAEVA